MGKQQRINRISGRTLRGTAGAINVNNAAYNTADMSGAIIAGGIADGINALGGAVDKMFKIDQEIQDKADQTGIDQAKMFQRLQFANFKPQKDPEKGKEYIQQQAQEFDEYIAGLEGISERGRERLTVLSKNSQAGFEMQQRFGRAKMIDNERNALLTTNLENSVKAGDEDLTQQWAETRVKEGYMLEAEIPAVIRQAKMYKQINIANTADYLTLEGMREDLDEVDKKGKSKNYPGLELRELANVKSTVNHRINVARANAVITVNKELAEGKIKNEFDLKKYYTENPELGIKAYNSLRKQFTAAGITAGKVKARIAAGDLDYKIVTTEWAVSPEGRVGQYADMLQEINAAAIDNGVKASKIKQLKSRFDASNNPNTPANKLDTFEKEKYSALLFKEIEPSINVEEKDWVINNDQDDKTKELRTLEADKLKFMIKNSNFTYEQIDAHIETLKTKYKGKEYLKDFKNTYLNTARPRAATKPDQPSSGTVIRKASDGTRWIYDSKTRKPIRKAE